MDEAILLAVAIAFLVGLVGAAAAFTVLWSRLSRARRERDLLARRITSLERAAAVALSPPPAAAPARPTGVALHAPPAEDAYAAAEAELLDADAVDGAAGAEAIETGDVRVGTGGGADGAAQTGDTVPPPLPAGRPTGEPLSAAPRAHRPAAFSLEDFLGGRVLLVVGVVVVLFALGFFLKYAIERDLVSPPLRVAIGVATGLAALFGGDLMRRRGFDVFGHAVMGGGLGALLLSTFFAAARYELIGRPPAFAVTAVVTLAGVVLALRREAPLLAYLGFLGGYLAPAILGENRDALLGLTSWLMALHAGLFVVLWRRRWPGLDLMALIASAVYFAGWWSQFAAPTSQGAAAGALAALTLAMLVLALAPGVLRRRPALPTALLTAIVTGSASVSAGFELFHPEHRLALGMSIVGLGALYALAARRAVGTVRGTAVDAPVLHGCAVAAAAAAVPAFLEGGALAPAWAAAGVVAILLAALHRSPVILVGGLVMIALAQVDLLDNRMPMHDGAFTPFANGAFLSFAAPSVALVMAGLILRWRSPWTTVSGLMLGLGAWMYAPVLVAEVASHFAEDAATYGSSNHDLALAGGVAALGTYSLVLALIVRRSRAAAIVVPLGTLAVVSLFTVPMLLFTRRAAFAPIANAQFVAGATVVAAWWACTRSARGALRVVLLVSAVLAGLVLLGGECAAYGENASTVGTSREALERIAQVWMSVTFAVYGAALLVTGFVRGTAALRWSGLGIFALTLGKVFLVDMAQLPTAHRIGGFLALGLLLLGASFLYQRARKDA